MLLISNLRKSTLYSRACSGCALLGGDLTVGDEGDIDGDDVEM